MSALRRPITRRRFLKGALAALLSCLGFSSAREAARPTAAHAGSVSCHEGLRHLSWVWHFAREGTPEVVAFILRVHNLGIILKTHDGTAWMGEYDASPHAVSGPEQLKRLVRYFEERGVPFHAWAVVQGREPEQEAAMGAEVLAAGARSLTLDLEPWRGFWVGTTGDAVTLGKELRRRQPSGSVKTALDPRPWVVDRVPVAEFAAFSNALVPLIYWETFNTDPNRKRYAESGWPPGPGGLTPEFLLDVTVATLARYNLPIEPVGQGAAPDMDAWQRFLGRAFAAGMAHASVWRYGVTHPEVWRLLRENPAPNRTYVVQPGDTLRALSRWWGVSSDDIVQLNRLADPNLIHVGQVLCIPPRRYFDRPMPARPFRSFIPGLSKD